VTEAVTGLDLVEWQLRVAAGEPPPLSQGEITLTGHAVEARLYAESPASDFLPSIGRLSHLSLPRTVRVDGGVEQGDEVSPHYDPMIAKLIAHGPDRATAIGRLAKACAEVEVWPVRTNAGFLTRLVEHPDFAAAQLDTGFIGDRLADLLPPETPSQAAWSAAAALRVAETAPGPTADPWAALKGFRLGALARPEALLAFGTEVRNVAAPDETMADVPTGAMVDGALVVFEAGEAYGFAASAPQAAGAGAAGDGQVLAPMPGKVTALHAQAGQALAKGAPILTLEAMKMEHTLVAAFDGVLETLSVAAGDQVSEGQVLARLDQAQA
ncbi:MAG TPA: biotin/lipoyl-binding protein, partial [Phenylobacterium sp.]|nr:biotin/lipoyl-binding protein [Phenylobacterium sp.]